MTALASIGAQTPAVLVTYVGVTIETARLRMRPLRDDDLADLVAETDDWEIVRLISRVPYPYSEAHGREWVALVRQHHMTGHPRRFGIALKETDRLIGCVGGSNSSTRSGDARAGVIPSRTFAGTFGSYASHGLVGARRG